MKKYMLFSELHHHNNSNNKSNNNKNRDEKIIIAFSGGADSRYLLQKIYESCIKGDLKKENIIVAHFNHHMREEDSDILNESQRDAEFSQKISEELGFRFELGHWEKIKGEKVSENSARSVRYEFLENIRERYAAKYILTAHHKDDQAETIFLQFLRGGGVNALTGMKKISEERFLYRPLLNISKQNILDYLSQNKISFCEDSTNKESVFTRNFLRNEVFPLIEKKFPNFSERIAEKSEYFQVLQNEFETDSQKFLNNNDFQKGVLRENFLKLSSPVSFEVIKKIIAPKFCSQKLFSEISGFIDTGNSGKKFILTGFEFEVFGEMVWLKNLDIKGEY